MSTYHAKHTPGPWVVSIGMDVLVTCPDGRSFNIGDAIYHPENIANAHLIAASPDMLRELEETATWLEERAAILTELSEVGGPSKAAAAKRQAIRDEAARFRGRAALIRQTIAKTKVGA